MDWKEARKTSKLTIDDVWLAWKMRPMPGSVRAEVSRSKLGRLFDLKKEWNVPLSAVAKAHLAAVLDVPLSTIDEAAASDYRELTDPDARIPTWGSASPIRAA